MTEMLTPRRTIRLASWIWVLRACFGFRICVPAFAGSVFGCTSVPLRAAKNYSDYFLAACFSRRWLMISSASLVGTRA